MRCWEYPREILQFEDIDPDLVNEQRKENHKEYFIDKFISILSTKNIQRISDEELIEIFAEAIKLRNVKRVLEK